MVVLKMQESEMLSDTHLVWMINWKISQSTTGTLWEAARATWLHVYRKRRNQFKWHMYGFIRNKM